MMQIGFWKKYRMRWKLEMGMTDCLVQWRGKRPRRRRMWADLVLEAMGLVRGSPGLELQSLLPLV